jgi:hypothetical protein
MKNKTMKNYLEDVLNEDDAVLFADGLEDAFIGIGYQFHRPIAIYSQKKVIEGYEKDGMTYDEASEFFDFNVGGAWAGESTPIFLNDLEL